MGGSTVKRILLGLDAGTTSFKAALFTEDKRLLAACQCDYALLASGDRVEFPAEEYWQTLCRLIRDLLSRAPVPAQAVTALAISSQGETLIALDEDDRPLGNAIVWLDNRAVQEADELRARFGRARIYRETGQADMLATWPAAKLLWLRRHRPRDFQRARKFLLLEDYLLYRLTGRFAGEPNLWASSAMLNIHTGRWWDEMLRAVGVERQRLPLLHPCGAPVGPLLPGAAAETGLCPGTLAVAGALDQSCNAVGCGITRPGMVYETTGSCLAVGAIRDEFAPYDPALPVTCQNFAAPGRYALLLWSQSAGMTLKWFAQRFYQEYADLDEAFARMNADAAAVEAGCGGLTALPHLTGASNPEYDPCARGVFCGATLQHGRAHFTRAVMESVACMLRRNLEQLTALGVDFNAVACMGGGANSRIWLQIKADVANKPMRPLRARESACLGAAILAGVGAGLFESVDWTPEEGMAGEIAAPDPVRRAACEALYRRYVGLYEALKPFFAQNARIESEGLPR